MWRVALLLACCATNGIAGKAVPADTVAAREGTMKLTSTAFAQGQPIPARSTCEGDDTAPPLAWTGVPAGAKSLALVIEDPDAPDPAKPTRTWVHEVVYDIPPGTTGLPEGGALPAGARFGKNDWGKTGYGGPCPPIGRHRYFFRLYALDVVLGNEGLTRAQLTRSMSGHVLDEAELMGTYQKGG